MIRWWQRLMDGFVQKAPAHTNDARCWCRTVVGADCYLVSYPKLGDTP